MCAIVCPVQTGPISQPSVRPHINVIIIISFLSITERNVRFSKS